MMKEDDEDQRPGCHGIRSNYTLERREEYQESPMAFVGQPRPSEACGFLGVPGLSFLDADDDDEVVIGIRPKSSPRPRRRSSSSDEDSEPEPPLSGSRRVSFADALGLSLVQVKEFDTWDVPKLPECDSSEGEGKDAEEFFISPVTFSLPLPTEELFVKVRDQKVELETIELLPGTTILKGVIRVLNVSFDKAVYVRTTLDTWSSHFDLLAEYMPGSSDSLTDCFSFKLTLVPPFGEQGARVDFCLRYETPVGTFWNNNKDMNYVLSCHQRVKERKETPQKEKVNKRSCLKTVGQNFSSVENISTTGAPSQENISTDVSEHGEEAMKAKQISDGQSGTSEEDRKQISDGQSGTSEEDRQKLLAESRQNCGRRNRRKAARMARVRDYFSQRNGGADDTERDESPPEAKAQEEEKHSDVRSCPEGSSKSEGSHFVSESLETGSEPLLDVPHDTSSPAHDYMPNGETSESIDMADSATLTGSESVTDVTDNPMHSNDKPAPAECQNISEESNATAKPADSVISAVSSSSFTFGTVVAPLYHHQVFGRAGSESDRGNPVRAVQHAGDLTQSYPHAERGQTSCTVPTDARGSEVKVQGSVIQTQEANQECLDDAPNSLPMEEEEEEEEETSLSMTSNDILDLAETLQDPDENIYSHQTSIVGETVVHPHTVNILNTDLSNPQIPAESSHLQGEAQEDSLTLDLQVPEQTCTQTNLDETLAQSGTREVITSLETSLMSPQPPQSLLSERVSDETDQQTSGVGADGCKCDHESNKTVTISTTNAISEEDKLIEALHDLKPEHMNDSATKETRNSYVSCFEIVKEKDVATPQISLITNNVEEGNKVVNNSCEHETKHSGDIKVIDEAAESPTRATISNHIHGDAFVELRDEDTRKIEHHEMEAAVTLDFCLADTAEVNWEMMVEEEEIDILTDEEESEAISLKTVEFEVAGRETASENGGTTETENEDEVVWEITAARERDAEDADVLESKQGIGEEEIVSGKEEERELEKEKHFAEIREVNVERTNVQDEEEIEEEEEEMEIDWNDDDEAGEEWEDQEEENPDYDEEILVDETGESESMSIEDRESEAGCFEERLDTMQNKVEDSLSVPVNNVERKRVIEKENGHVPTGMHLYDENVTYEPSEAARDENESVAAAEGDSCVFADEPESDQMSNDSASAESDSDDEVELYMHCLRAVHTGAQAQKDRSKDAGFSVGKRPSVSRSKLLSMPSISESLDEEQHLSRLQDNLEDAETADFQPAAAALPSGQESISRNVSWLKETFSCSNISKTLLYATSLVVFLVVAYRYDFLACFGLYLVSVVWLYCQRERQPEQQKRQQNRLN
ncbi:uncharacterized protein ppp1r3ab isoform X2 [Sebastes fasciatus]|uniref:uncharacterized protein ppp1r3ab isoform X2 n=1 Tax=Sebastes fasciatus TaxID=394691 RepID=UPI003D9F423E